MAGLIDFIVNSACSFRKQPALRIAVINREAGFEPASSVLSEKHRCSTFH